MKFYLSADWGRPRGTERDGCREYRRKSRVRERDTNRWMKERRERQERNPKGGADGKETEEFVRMTVHVPRAARARKDFESKIDYREVM